MDPHHSPDRALERLLSTQELADYLGVPKQTIYDWRVAGKGPKGYRFGKHLRFAASDVRAWVERHREPGGPPPGATEGVVGDG